MAVVSLPASMSLMHISSKEEVLVVDLAVRRHIHYIHIVTQIYIWLWKSRGSNGSGVVAYIIWSNNMCGR